MSSLRKLVVLVGLCLMVGTAAASAAERPFGPAGREVGMVARIVRDLQAFLKGAWENLGFEIDPWGRSSQGNGGPTQEDPASPGADLGYDIDPWG